jgi:hypothetical protein
MQPNLSRSFVVLPASQRSRRSTVLIVSAPQSWAAHAYLIGPLKGGPFYSGPLGAIDASTLAYVSISRNLAAKITIHYYLDARDALLKALAI